MRTILTLLACTQLALAALAIQGCGGGGDAYAGAPVAVSPAPSDPKSCGVALVKLDGGAAACAPEH